MGLVLAGGASRRMGRAKATVRIDGVTMLDRVIAALRDGGCAEVLVVGGDPAWVEGRPAGWVPDETPGAGPLAGLETGFAALAGTGGGSRDASTIVLVAACDQPWLDGATVQRLVDGLRRNPDARSAAGRRGEDGWDVFPSSHRISIAGGVSEAVAIGARRADAIFGHGSVVEVQLDPSAVQDVDAPGDLPGSP